MANNVDQNKLVQLLLQENLLNKRQLKNALAEQQKTGKPLAQVLIDLRLITQGVLAELEASTLGVEQIRLIDLELDPAILSLIPRRIAEQYRAIPVRLSGNELLVAMENPHNVLAIDDIKLLTGKIIRPALCNNKDIDFALKHYPDGGAAAESVVVSEASSKSARLLVNLVFAIVMFAPLVILLWLIPSYPSLVKWLYDFEHLLAVLLWWGFYSIILYWGYGIFFEETKEKSRSPESTQP